MVQCECGLVGKREKKTSEEVGKVTRKSNGNLDFALRLNQILYFSGPDSSQLRWKMAISL